MKNFKKIASAIAALSLAACVAVPMSATVFTASAAGITVTGGNGTEDAEKHQYTAYRIFDGTATESGFNGTDKQTLTNVTWAGTDALSSLKDSELDITVDGGESKKLKDLFTSCSTAADVAKVLEEYDNNSSVAKAFAEWAVKNKASMAPETDLTNVEEDGYYVIEDTTASLVDGTKTLYLLGVYDAEKGATVNVKAEAPTFTKEIGDINDSTETAGTINWGDSADHDKYNSDEVPFKLTATLPADLGEYDHYQLVFHDDLEANVFDAPADDSFEVKIFHAGGTEVKTLDKDTNWTKEDGCGEQHGSHANGSEDKCDFTIKIADLLGGYTYTAGDYVEVTYKAKFNGNTIVGSAGNWNTGLLEYSNNPYNKGAGETDTHSKTPEKSVVAFTYKTVINKLNEEKKTLAGASFKLEKKTPTGTYELVKEITLDDTGVTDGVKNVFSFEGLDDGTYKLTETKTPDGYNSIDPIEFTVTATHDTTPSITLSGSPSVSGAIELTANPSEGSLSADVVNQKGATLPSTGGIGTTLFYLGGGALVAVAGVMLITKKRMTKE